jgi:hypothetical protein
MILCSDRFFFEKKLILILGWEIAWEEKTIDFIFFLFGHYYCVALLYTFVVYFILLLFGYQKGHFFEVYCGSYGFVI